MSQDIRALADEIAKLNRNSTLWAQPQINQSGAASMLTQNQVQLQPYMQNFANATPGAMSPASMHADPRAANYALQQQLFLNPYRAQAYGGEFNSNMPGAEYATSSRFGIYRPGLSSTQAGTLGQSSFTGDVTALAGYKSYAGYQDPYQEQANASRRMTQRFEHATMGAVELGGIAASTYLGGSLGLAAGMAGIAPVAYATSQFAARRNEMGQIQNVSQDLISGTSASGIGSRGVGMRTAAEMMLDMRSYAAADPTKSLEDVQSVFETGAATGLFGFEGSADKITDKVKKASGMVNTMMRLAEDPDIQSTIKRMADFQSMGVSIGQMERMATDIKAFAGLANTSFENVMSQGASMGAQQAQMMGGSAAFGMRVGGLSQGMANRMIQSGVMSPEQTALRGGKSGITQNLSSILTNEIHSLFSSQAGAMMDMDGSEATLNQEGMARIMSGEITRNINPAISGAGKNMFSYHRNVADITAKAESQLSSLDILNTLSNKIDAEAATMPGMSRSDYISAKYGTSGREVEQLLSKESRSDVAVSLFREHERTATAKKNEAKVSNFLLEKAMRSVAQFKDELFSSDIYADLGEFEDRRAANAAGGIYRPGREDTSFLSKSAKERFRQFNPTSEEKYSFDTDSGGLFKTEIGNWLGGSKNESMRMMKEQYEDNGMEEKTGISFEDAATTAFDSFGAISPAVNKGGRLKLTRGKKNELEKKLNKLLNSGDSKSLNLHEYNLLPFEQQTEVMRYAKFHLKDGDPRKLAIGTSTQGRIQGMANVALMEDDRDKLRKLKKQLGLGGFKSLMKLEGAGINIQDISNLYEGTHDVSKLSPEIQKDYYDLMEVFEEKGMDIERELLDGGLGDKTRAAKKVLGADSAQKNRLVNMYAGTESIGLYMDTISDKELEKLKAGAKKLGLNDDEASELAESAKETRKENLLRAMTKDNRRPEIQSAMTLEKIYDLMSGVKNNGQQGDFFTKVKRLLR